MIPYYTEHSFQLESIPCVYLQEILKRLLAKLCLDASFLCLHRFVAFHVTFNDLCCLWQPCGLLSWIHLWVTNQSLQTGQNDSVIHFEVAFVVC